MVKRLGGKRWVRLHRVVYLSGACGVLHYYMLVKSDVRPPLTFAFVLALLLGFRLFAKYYSPRPRSNSVIGLSD
jgi:methionine sulfoxide reductase heme-binding subunit